MFTKTINYENFNGDNVTKTLHFNLTQSEIVDFAMELPTGVAEAIGDPTKVNEEEAAVKLMDTIGSKGIVDFLKKLVLKSYGIKSEDGESFVKSEKISEEFSHTMAYDTILMELLSDDTAAAAFVNNVIPAKLVAKMAEAQGGNKIGLPLNK